MEVSSPPLVYSRRECTKSAGVSGKNIPLDTLSLHAFASILHFWCVFIVNNPLIFILHGFFLGGVEVQIELRG